ncbi:uncharacterized protein [Periplaneta americana]|uniref:uncharacterized protein n=1 Tax=Periplaneta americana TaxID=6978 RepID=UPI0037E7C997
MEFFAYPDRLSNLATESLGRYVSDLVQRVKFPKCAETETFRLNYVQQICSYLGEMIHGTLPPSFANEVTIRMMRHVLLSYRDLIEYPCFRSYCEEIAPMVMTAILHPSVMKLECFENNPHPTVIDRYKVWYSDLIVDSLSELKNLRVLRLGSSNNFTERRLNRRDFSEKLEEFSYRFCEDEELDALSKTSTKLKRLDLTDSYLTDVSIDYILRFKHLEELVINCVLITQDGITKLLTGLAKTDETVASTNPPELLKSFGCNNPSVSNLNVLADKFPNITSLSLRNVQCSLTALKSLKRLTKLSLRTVIFCFIEELLREIGSQIMCLNLRDVHDTDLRVIGENCSALKCLHLSFIKFLGLQDYKFVEYSEKFPLPEFRALTCLELKLFDDNFSQYIMSRCGNVKKLFLSDGGSQTLINILLQRKQLMSLEQLFFTESQNVDIVVQFTDNAAIFTEVDYFSDKISLHSTPVKY